MNCAYILLDLDGTLTDSGHGITRSVQYALRRHGIEVEDLNELVCFIGPPLVESFQVFYGFSPEEAVECVHDYRVFYKDEGIFDNRLYPGIAEMMRQLKDAGKTISLATNKPEVFARQILKYFEIDSYFDEIVGCGMDESHLTKEDILEEVFRRLGMGPEERQQTVMVGDRKYDITAAKYWGTSSVGVTYGFAPEGELASADADALAATVPELTEILLG